jgi:hypothetical protein
MVLVTPVISKKVVFEAVGVPVRTRVIAILHMEKGFPPNSKEGVFNAPQPTLVIPVGISISYKPMGR